MKMADEKDKMPIVGSGAKAILVMDMPKECGDCWFCRNGMGGLYCDTKEGAPTRIDKAVSAHAIACGCPLIPAIGYIEAKGNMISWEDDGDE